jgi:hypothetical protein
MSVTRVNSKTPLEYASEMVKRMLEKTKILLNLQVLIITRQTDLKSRRETEPSSSTKLSVEN